MKLEIGTNDHFEVRHEQYPGTTAGGFSILYLSDLHFNRHSIAMIEKTIQHIKELNPDIILLGGDYVDFKKQLRYLDRFLQFFLTRKNVFAIAGNHDYNFNVSIIKERMEANNIAWIEKASATINIYNTTIQIDGSKPLAGKSNADFNILCLHQPINISKFKDRYNVAFAGHLHGSQFVFHQQGKALFPGRLFFKWNVLEKKVADCHYYISKGMGDTLPVRFNCVKDMLFVDVIAKNKNGLN